MEAQEFVVLGGTLAVDFQLQPALSVLFVMVIKAVHS